MNNPSRLPLILLYSALILLTGLFLYLLVPPRPLLSPLANITFTNPQPPSSNYLILGFLPYWNLKKLQSEAVDTITHLTYFTLHLNASGNLVKLETSISEDPGYTNYKRLLSSRQEEANPPPLLLTFMPYDQEALTSLLNSTTARTRAISTIKSLLLESGAAGLNIDFEPLGGVTPSQRNNFTLFIKDLRQELCLIQPCPLLSVSIYPSAASRPRLWDLSALSAWLDHFVVMTYDYHLPSNTTSGPNAPLRGAGELFEHDILTNLAEITNLVPSEQILLGIPFYGYEWSTDTNQKYPTSSSRGSVASLERIDSLIKDDTLELLWDRNSLTPYAIRRENDQIISQIYFESIDSIRLKLELVRSAHLGGIAIWALGYEGENPALWSTIDTLNRP